MGFSEMENLDWLIQGFGEAATPMNLLYAVIGVLLGTAVGVLPGIGPAMTVALLLPITYNVSPSAAFIMFAGIFYGGMYGGSTTSILLNTPGESSSVITAIEGNKMAKAGRAAQALATAAIGSFVAGTIGTILLAAFAPAISRFAVTLGAPSYLAIMLFALVAVTAVLGSSKLRGAISLFLGLAIGVVGIDFLTGQPRATFGIPLLSDGIDIVIIAVAVFALGEALWVAAHLRRRPADVIPVGRPWMGKSDWQRSWKPWLRGTAYGFPFGALPAGGAELPTFLSYITEKRLSKHKEEFGKGAIEGVAGPEAANNASAAGTLGADALAWPAHQRHGRCDADRVRLVRNPARTNTVREGAVADLDAHRQSVHRQSATAATQPSACAVVGQAASHTAALPVRGHPVLRDAGRARGERAAVGFGAVVGVRSARLDDAPVRAAGPAADHRRDSRPPNRAPAPAISTTGRRRLEQPVHRAGRDHRVRAHGGASADAAGAQTHAPQ